LAQALVDQIANQMVQAEHDGDEPAAASIAVSQAKQFEAAQELMKVTANINRVTYIGFSYCFELVIMN